MRKSLLLLVLACSMFASGCATLTETPVERDRRILNGWSLDTKMMTEDWDQFWLVDRSSMLTQWHPHVGN